MASAQAFMNRPVPVRGNSPAGNEVSDSYGNNAWIVGLTIERSRHTFSHNV